MMKSMRQTGIFAAMAAVVILLAGCEKESGNTVDNTPVKACITSSIDGMATRAANTAWAAGDHIGIYAIEGDTDLSLVNADYVTKNGDGVFTAVGEDFYFSSKETVNFFAYYPFTGTDGNSPGLINKEISAADQTPAGQAQIDYLYAWTSGSAARPNMQFRFNHCMSRIVLKFLPGDGITSLSDIEYMLGEVLLEGTFDPAAGEAEADIAMPAAALTMSVPGSDAAELSSSLIFFPQKGDDDKTLTLTMRGVTYTATFKFRENTANNNVRELAAGYSYIYNVKVNNATMTISPATIGNWGDGGSENIDSTAK